MATSYKDAHTPEQISRLGKMIDQDVEKMSRLENYVRRITHALQDSAYEGYDRIVSISKDTLGLLSEPFADDRDALQKAKEKYEKDIERLNTRLARYTQEQREMRLRSGRRKSTWGNYSMGVY